MGDVLVGVVWACILIFVWLRDKIRVQKSGVARLCEVARFNLFSYEVLLPRNLIKT